MPRSPPDAIAFEGQPNGHLPPLSHLGHTGLHHVIVHFVARNSMLHRHLPVIFIDFPPFWASTRLRNVENACLAVHHGLFRRSVTRPPLKEIFEAPPAPERLESLVPRNQSHITSHHQKSIGH